MAEQVYEIAQHFNLRECLGLGVGNGGYILSACATAHPSLFAGLILISPSFKQAGWWEWGMGSLAIAHLRRWGWTPTAKDHFTHRLLSPAAVQFLGGESELVKALHREFESLNPLAVATYLSAVLSRPRLGVGVGASPGVKGTHLRCRVLLIYGSQGMYEGDSLELSTSAVDKSKFALFEVQEGGVLVNEERPTELLSPLRLFLTSLQLEGIGLGESLEIGR